MIKEESLLEFRDWSCDKIEDRCRCQEDLLELLQSHLQLVSAKFRRVPSFTSNCHHQLSESCCKLKSKFQETTSSSW